MTSGVTAAILPASPQNIGRVAEHLRNGGVAGIPTETVYGLAGNAMDASALAKIFNAKERPTFDPLIVHVSRQSGNLAALEKLKLIRKSLLSPLAQELADRLLAAFWPGPFTLVLPKDEAVPDLATSGLPTVAIRMPRHPVAQTLIERAGFPLAAPSANRFGRISPTSAPDVLAELGDRIEWILDGGPCEVGLESTVLSIAEDATLTLLRPGGTPVAEIERIAGTQVRTPGARAPLQAPGMLDSHYAPEKQLRLLPDAILNLSLAALSELIAAPSKEGKIGLLLFEGDPERTLAQLQSPQRFEARSLSLKGNLEEAARNLFAALRQLDSIPAIEYILAEPCPVRIGLGHAISDRLLRASQKEK